jgi:hypothetical protein
VLAGTQRTSALRLTEPGVQALLQVLLLFQFMAHGFTNAQLRAPFAALLGLDPSTMTLGRMTYQLRRLKLHGLIRRIPHSHRYQVTESGIRTALFFTRVYHRLILPGYAACNLPTAGSASAKFDRLGRAMDACFNAVQLANPKLDTNRTTLEPQAA